MDRLVQATAASSLEITSSAESLLREASALNEATVDLGKLVGHSANKGQIKPVINQDQDKLAMPREFISGKRRKGKNVMDDIPLPELNHSRKPLSGFKDF